MQHAIELTKKISKDLLKEWKEELWEYHMPETFSNIYSTTTIANANRIICFIVYAYSPDSLWLDLRKDRLENKQSILKGLGADIKNEIFEDVINGKHEISGMAIFDFLEGLKSWKWRAIFDYLEYSSKMSRFATQETELEKTFDKMNKEGEVKTLTQEYDLESISKINKEKGLLLDQSVAKRKQADVLLEEIKKEYVVVDNATQNDFGFSFTETAKKRDHLSWKEFIQDRNERMKRAAVVSSGAPF